MGVVTKSSAICNKCNDKPVTTNNVSFVYKEISFSAPAGSFLHRCADCIKQEAIRAFDCYNSGPEQYNGESFLRIDDGNLVINWDLYHYLRRQRHRGDCIEGIVKILNVVGITQSYLEGGIGVVSEFDTLRLVDGHPGFFTRREYAEQFARSLRLPHWWYPLYLSEYTQLDIPSAQ